MHTHLLINYIVLQSSRDFVCLLFGINKIIYHTDQAEIRKGKGMSESWPPLGASSGTRRGHMKYYLS